MDESKVREWIAANEEKLRAAMGLAHWKVTWFFEPLTARTGGPDDACLGRCEILPDYDRAIIRLNFAELEDESHLERIAVHELLHVTLVPMQVYREWASQTIEGGSAADHQEDRLWDYLIEQTLLCLERLWRRRPDWPPRPDAPIPAPEAPVDAAPPADA